MDVTLLGQYSSPTPTLALPVLYLQRGFFIYFIIENKCLSMPYEIWKGEKKVCQKGESCQNK